MTTISAQTVAMLITDALNSKWFNIVPLSQCHLIYNTPYQRDELLASLHCVNWDTMTEEQQYYCINKTLDTIEQVSGHTIIVE